MGIAIIFDSGGENVGGLQYIGGPLDGKRGIVLNGESGGTAIGDENTYRLSESSYAIYKKVSRSKLEFSGYRDSRNAS